MEQTEERAGSVGLASFLAAIHRAAIELFWLRKVGFLLVVLLILWLCWFD